MIEKTDCCYKTPCGWCSKWDKRCDLKMGDTSDIYANQVFVKEYPTVGRDFRYDTGPTCTCNTTSANGCGEALKQN